MKLQGVATVLKTDGARDGLDFEYTRLPPILENIMKTFLFAIFLTFLSISPAMPGDFSISYYDNGTHLPYRQRHSAYVEWQLEMLRRDRAHSYNRDRYYFDYRRYQFRQRNFCNWVWVKDQYGEWYRICYKGFR